MGKQPGVKAKSATDRALDEQDKRNTIVVPKGSIATAPELDITDESDSALTLDVDVTRETLEGTPVRALTFLKAIGTSAAIRALLASRGYRVEDHMEGWRLLHAVSGFHDAEVPEEDASVRNAIQQIDEWDEGGFQIIAATLKYRFPEQARFLLTGLKAASGAAAVLGVRQLLDRLDALESGKARADTPDKDHAALAILAQRGIDTAQRNRLRALLAVAESAPEISLPDAESAQRSEASYLQNLTALRAWFEEWTGIARVAIKRRDYLIRLGLARRHAKAAEPTLDSDSAVKITTPV